MSTTVALPHPAEIVTEVPAPGRQRYDAIDWVRGVVMVLMALDHVRFFFTNAPFPPEAMQHTTPALFLTRWITHFCAPAFFFLAGTAAYLRGRRGRRDLSIYLAQRGMMLITLELTVIGFGWCFRPGYSFGGVFWALGWSMILLAVVSRLKTGFVLALGAGIVAGHHVLESVGSSESGPGGILWHLLYGPGNVTLPFGEWLVLYPLIPWCGVMMLGYAAGAWFNLDRQRRVCWSRQGARRSFSSFFCA